MRYLIALVGIVIGFLIIWKSEWIFEQFGRVDWAEINLSGGTRFFWKLVGLAIIFASLFFMSGILEGIVTFIFVPKPRGGI
jgi:NhaP-type Na+/H+ or K+/H+ antiporter